LSLLTVTARTSAASNQPILKQALRRLWLSRIGLIVANTSHLAPPYRLSQAMKKALVAIVSLAFFIGAWQLLKALWSYMDAYRYFDDGPRRIAVPSFGSDYSCRPVRYGLIDHNGKMVVPAMFKDTGSFHEGRCAVKQAYRTGGYGWGFIDKTGKVIVPIKYDRVHDYSEGLAAVHEPGGWGFVDLNGEWVIKPQFTNAGEFNHGIALVRTGGRQGLIDKQGNYVLKPVYEIEDGHNGAMLIERGGKYGFVDTSGRLICDTKFDDAMSFSEDLAAVYDGSKWGFIDKSANYAIKPSFEKAAAFHHGLAAVAINNKFGLIDRHGNFVLPPKYKYLAAAFHDAEEPVPSFISEEVMPLCSENRWGFASTKTGLIVIAPKYATVSPFSEGLARVALLNDEKAVPRHRTYKSDTSAESSEEEESADDVDEASEATD
jgi:hypothetical protein